MNIMDKDHESLGMRVRRLRKESDWSMDDLARRARLNSKTIWNLEAEARMPRVDTMIQLARALGVSLDYLCCESDVRSRAIETEEA